MGGKGSGGGRAGAGRKPKDATLGARHGSRRTRARQRKKQTGNQNVGGNQKAPGADAPPPASVLPDLPIPPPPGNLTLDELAVWNELAPLASLESTLNDSTCMAFRDLCEAIVLKRKLLRTIDTDGLTVITLQGNQAAHPLLPQFRGLMQRVEAAMLRFRLSPMGKEIPKPGDQPIDPFAEFDGAGVPTPGETRH